MLWADSCITQLKSPSSHDARELTHVVSSHTGKVASAKTGAPEPGRKELGGHRLRL